MPMLLELDPDIADVGTYGFCKRCECEVLVVKRDCGIGLFEYWGSKGVHVDMQDCCATCGDEL